MEFFEVIRMRRSTRKFARTPIEAEKLQLILETANRAPSAGNLQAYEICVVKNRTMLNRLAHAAFGQEFIAQAPVALVFCANPMRSAARYAKRGTTLYCIQDATIACAYAQLAATALGLASTWVGAFDENAVRDVIGVDNGWLPVVILPVGRPGEKPELTTRRSLAHLVHDIS